MSGAVFIPATRRPLVLVDTRMMPALADRLPQLEQRGAFVRPLDYRRLMDEADALRQFIREHAVDFVLFSRNDQVYDRVSIGPLIRALGVGYSSFSGLDADRVIEQTLACLDDYLAGNSRLNLPDHTPQPPPALSGSGTFSLIFDLEQLGGARFGLPRLLDLLARYAAPATFFTTSFIQQVYHDTLDSLRQRGHEIGLHGRYHEYLTGHSLEQQTAMIADMKRDFQAAEPVCGANFIYRMDARTLDAMAASDLLYFVVFMMHAYRPFAYAPLPVRPMRFWTPQGSIWMAPVSVETNNRPWFTIRNALESALAVGQATGWPHVNVLMHPFRDGSRRHIGDVERILHYLRHTRGYRPARLADVIQPLPRFEPRSWIYYLPDGIPASTGRPVRWRSGYEQRVGRLYDALDRSGHQPALCVTPPTTGTIFAVEPCVPHAAQVIPHDPLAFNHRAAVPLPALNGSHEPAVYAYAPEQGEFTNWIKAARPRRRQDYTGFLPELGLRATYRLSRGRHIF